MEYYYPENINIAVLCQASSAVINKQISKILMVILKYLFNSKIKQNKHQIIYILILEVVEQLQPILKDI